MSREEERLADLVNSEPIVFMDCTQSELMGAFLGSCAVAFVIGIGGGLLVGQVVLGLLLSLLLSLVFSWFALNWLRDARQKYYLTWFAEKQFLLKRQGASLLPWKWFSSRATREILVDFSKRFSKGARRG